MNESQLRNELPLGSFQGVFACDELIPPRCLPASYIVNTDPRKKPGKHWIALYITKNRAEYFDSFGRPPNGLILKFLKRVNKEIFYNAKCVQHDESISCGVYCLYFLRKRSRSVSPSKTLLKLSTIDKIKNELTLIKFFVLKS